MADERSCPRSRDVDRHETELREIRQNFILKELALTMIAALTARVADLEDELKSIRRGNRVAILGATTAIGTAVVLQFFQKGGH